MLVSVQMNVLSVGSTERLITVVQPGPTGTGEFVRGLTGLNINVRRATVLGARVLFQYLKDVRPESVQDDLRRGWTDDNFLAFSLMADPEGAAQVGVISVPTQKWREYKRLVGIWNYQPEWFRFEAMTVSEEGIGQYRAVTERIISPPNILHELPPDFSWDNPIYKALELQMAENARRFRAGQIK